MRKDAPFQIMRAIPGCKKRVIVSLQRRDRIKNRRAGWQRKPERNFRPEANLWMRVIRERECVPEDRCLETAEISQSVSDTLGAYDRYEEFVSRNFCKLSYRIDRTRNFAVNSTLHALDGFMVGRFATSGGKGDLIRTRMGIAEDARGRFALYIPMRGDLELMQFSRTEYCRPGSMAMVSMEEPFTQRKMGDNDTIYFFMPQSFVDQRLIGSEDLCARGFSIDSGIRKLVHDSVVSLQTGAVGMSDGEFRGASRTLGELVLLALNSSVDMMTDEPSVRTSTLARAKRAIRAQLGDTELTIAAVAKQCGISLRYLHELFRADGVTVSEYVKAQRLQKARHMLETASDGMTVTDICFRCGFSNPSQFSTAFRQAFSVSPRDVLRNPRYWGA
jgi:AraC-like DNA-binding protein